MAKYDLVIFDLDGTLLNTLDDLAAAANHALARAGFPRRTVDEVRQFIGNGVARLIRLSVPENTPDAVCEAVLADFKAYYAEHLNDHTVPYDGMPQLLDALRGKGIRTAVNSNKLDSATQKLCAANFPGQLDMALGERAGIPRKPSPEGVALILRELNVAPERALYVGDGDADILTAKNAGIDGAWVSWGYRRREELEGLELPVSFDTVEALEAYILED